MATAPPHRKAQTDGLWRKGNTINYALVAPWHARRTSSQERRHVSVKRNNAMGPENRQADKKAPFFSPRSVEDSKCRWSPNAASIFKHPDFLLFSKEHRRRTSVLGNTRGAASDGEWNVLTEHVRSKSSSWEIEILLHGTNAACAKTVKWIRLANNFSFASHAQEKMHVVSRKPQLPQYCNLRGIIQIARQK